MDFEHISEGPYPIPPNENIPETTDSPEYLEAKLLRFFKAGIDPVTRQPFTPGELIDAMDRNGKFPMFTIEALSRSLELLCENGHLAFDESTGRYHLKNLA